MDKEKIQQGSHKANDKYYIKVMENGPFLVYGNPPLSQQIITNNEDGNCWDFVEGKSFEMNSEPVALCRCGFSRNKPYCDGAHLAAGWDPELTAPDESLLEGANLYQGPELDLSDNERYCVFARFCDAKGRVWNLVGQSDRQPQKDYTVHEANMCPGGRLSAWDKRSGQPFEPHYEPSLGLIEDKPLAISAGLWVRGGIPVRREDGRQYEIRNRVVLCRCGVASNKPFCDGSHASLRFNDGLMDNND